MNVNKNKNYRYLKIATNSFFRELFTYSHGTTTISKKNNNKGAIP